MGGVLVNWNPKQIVQDIFEGRECMLLEKWYRLLHSDIFKELDRGAVLQKDFLEMLPQEYDKDQLIYLFKHLYKHLFPLKKGIEILNLVKVAGFKTYILSNFGKEVFEEARYQYGFLDKFDGAIFSFQVKQIKPEPEIYQTLLNNYSLRAEESLFIDDMQINIEAAKKLGIDGIVCKNHTSLFKKLQELEVIPYSRELSGEKNLEVSSNL